MSKDMLGPLTRALVGAPTKMLGLLLDIANRFGAVDGEIFYSDLAKFVREWKKQVAKKIETDDFIIRPFKVDRKKTPPELLASCNRVPWCIDQEVLKSMPMDGPEEGELVFFPLKRNTPVAEIPRILDEHDLVLDYAAQMQVNADDPVFADEHPNGMQWDKNSFASFRRLGDERGVRVDRGDGYWHDYIWFAGRRK